MESALKDCLPEGPYTEEDYYNMPENAHMELIDGYFYDMSAPSQIHQKMSGLLYTAIHNYIQSKNGFCEVYYAPFAVKLRENKKNIVEPDISVICDPDKLTEQGCNGAPDWIIEIVSPGNAGHDYVKKLNLYMEAGVLEYWIVDPLKQTIFVYSFLEKDFFDLQHYTFQDKIKAGIYPDFFIDFREFNL